MRRATVMQDPSASSDGACDHVLVDRYGLDGCAPEADDVPPEVEGLTTAP